MADYTINYDEIAEWLEIYKTTENEKQKKHLQNVIVEFALFDKEVGIRQERIIVYELRTHYKILT